MLRRALLSVAKIAYPRPTIQTYFRSFSLQKPIGYPFSSDKSLSVADIPAENVQIRASEATVGEVKVDFYRTEGGISILDKVKGVKSSESGQLYVLSFTCNVCQTKMIRSFTKQAYHNGVVLVKCDGCEGTHLVADNLGWFDDKPVNLDTTYEGKVQKVHDHVAIVKFLKAAFEDEANSKAKESPPSEKVEEEGGRKE